jgi:hypothetical protein
MRSSMKELRIEYLEVQNTNVVHLALRVGQSSLIYLTAKNRSGEKEISIRFGYKPGIPYAISTTSFDAPNSDMDGEEVKNRVLDWLISKDGSSVIENAID